MPVFLRYTQKVVMENKARIAKGEIKNNKVSYHVLHHHPGHPWCIQHQITSSKNKITQNTELKNKKFKCIRFRGRVYIKVRSNVIAVMPHTDKLRIQLQTLALH
jgi:hypothetical protein